MAAEMTTQLAKSVSRIFRTARDAGLGDFGWPTSHRSPQSLFMRARRLIPLLWLAFFLGPFLAAQTAAPYNKVTVETSSTSIYIGKVTLSVAPLSRKNGVFSGDYKAKVFPYWFMGEQGTFRMNVTDEELARVAKGETVDFTGDAQNSGSEPRKVTGRATPSDATTGKIKVRIFVTEKIQLIFNTTYKFEG